MKHHCNYWETYSEKPISPKLPDYFIHKIKETKTFGGCNGDEKDPNLMSFGKLICSGKMNCF